MLTAGADAVSLHQSCNDRSAFSGESWFLLLTSALEAEQKCNACNVIFIAILHYMLL
jgi:hypothetical protein